MSRPSKRSCLAGPSHEQRADVSTRLGQQVLEALQILLEGFEDAAGRDGDQSLAAAMREPGNHVYEGLLTVMLRLIFALYAEARALLPIEHPRYARQLSVGGLHDELVRDADRHAAGMSQRFGAWPRLISLFRALYFGDERLSMPPHHGRLFDPAIYTFLEGGLLRVTDEVVLQVLRRLLILDGQRLSYDTLDEEQLGSVYESLMGYEIERRPSTSERSAHLVIQPGEARRRTSSHYTPRALSGPIVERTLEPLLAALRAKRAREQPELADPQPRAADLLSLKICDPAMGSGAFLVESCRVLATELVAAWAREGSPNQPVEREASPHGGRRPSTGGFHGRENKHGRLAARRMVAQRCLFGVDKNPLAVELGKLSLWLLTRSRGLPFSCLDHRLKAGDSLVGLSKVQLLALDWRPTPKPTREPLWSSEDAGSERLRAVADILLSTYFFPCEDQDALTPKFLVSAHNISDKQRQACLGRVRDELKLWLGAEGSPPLPASLERRRSLVRACVRPLHWELEFPELFADADARFDAVVGNPPFSGKNAITNTNGPAYLSWLTLAYSPSHGNSDLSAYFFRRAAWMLGARGCLGLIATNTIGQGDTRATALQPLIAQGGQIYAATRDLKWPQSGANVSVSVVHLAKRKVAHEGLVCRLDGQIVQEINSQLRPAAERVDPVRLTANLGRSFVGSYVLGKGFVLTPEARSALVSQDARHAERIFPYLGGQAFNISPTQAPERHVINFGDSSLVQAGAWPALIDHLAREVKPARETNNRASYRKYWWQYAERRAGLYAAILPLERCLATSLTAKHRAFAFIPTNMVIDQTLIVTATGSMAIFGLLQSRLHIIWSAENGGAALELRPRYSPTRCFETFAFPEPATLGPDRPLEAIARRLYEARAAYMIATQQGLTKTYNALGDRNNRDPAVEQLRQLHEQLDRAVLEAYEQPRIVVPPYVGADPEQLDRFENEVLDLLFSRNALLAKREG